MNPRTGQPYVRPGGSYKKASAEGTSAASLAKLSQAAEKKVGDATVIATLRGEIATLKEQVRSLTEGRDLAVSAAELKIEKLTFSRTESVTNSVVRAMVADAAVHERARPPEVARLS